MEMHSRKILLQENGNKLLTSISPASAISPNQDTFKQTRTEALSRTQFRGQFSGFNADIVLILSILLCSFICAIAASIAVRCLLRCTRRTCSQELPDPSTNDEVENQSSMHIRKNDLLQVLPTLVYSSKLELKGSGSECTICLSEFKHGVHVRVLPVCNHGFHVRCIDKWLATRCTCPTCRRCLFGINHQDISQGGSTVNRVGLEPVEESMES